MYTAGDKTITSMSMVFYGYLVHFINYADRPDAALVVAVAQIIPETYRLPHLQMLSSPPKFASTFQVSSHLLCRVFQFDASRRFMTTTFPTEEIRNALQCCRQNA